MIFPCVLINPAVFPIFGVRLIRFIVVVAMFHVRLLRLLPARTAISRYRPVLSPISILFAILTRRISSSHCNATFALSLHNRTLGRFGCFRLRPVDVTTENSRRFACRLPTYQPSKRFVLSILFSYLFLWGIRVSVPMNRGTCRDRLGCYLSSSISDTSKSCFSAECRDSNFY